MNGNICSFKGSLLLAFTEWGISANKKTFNLLLLFEISYSGIFNEMDEWMNGCMNRWI
jgi:hypothetical protein